ncbi:hypothetical protein NA57DRAFT_60147 [Rhizodiscina lignyota]|uniref:Uncharacterized protein n=1 Tax=Rhizodiscina lignyota TaxID=1504668 RepID=A0A9P4I982_9PEZI|nr:hypothetical protein NA57DRAFT_60147 [Rhizodiscina lignyota]
MSRRDVTTHKTMPDNFIQGHDLQPTAGPIPSDAGDSWSHVALSDSRGSPAASRWSFASTDAPKFHATNWAIADDEPSELGNRKNGQDRVTHSSDRASPRTKLKQQQDTHMHAKDQAAARNHKSANPLPQENRGPVPPQNQTRNMVRNSEERPFAQAKLSKNRYTMLPRYETAPMRKSAEDGEYLNNLVSVDKKDKILVGLDVGNGSCALVHRALACTTSTFIREQPYAFRISFKDCSFDAVRLYSKWMYARNIFSICEASPTETVETVLSREIYLLAEAYKLGVVARDSSFRNAIIDSMTEMVLRDEFYLDNIIPWAYRNRFPSNCALIKLLVDLYIIDHQSVILEHFDPGLAKPNNLRPYPDKYWKDIMSRALDISGGLPGKVVEPLWTRKMCTYHDHADGERCL